MFIKCVSLMFLLLSSCCSNLKIRAYNDACQNSDHIFLPENNPFLKSDYIFKYGAWVKQPSFRLTDSATVMMIQPAPVT